MNSQKHQQPFYVCFFRHTLYDHCYGGWHLVNRVIKAFVAVLFKLTDSLGRRQHNQLMILSLRLRIIDIESLQNRLLKVCYVPATSAGLPRLLFLLRPLTPLMKQTRKAVHVVKQSILLRCLPLCKAPFLTANIRLG